MRMNEVKKEEHRKYRMETAKVSNARLISAKPDPNAPRLPQFENAREIILKLIEAIKRL